MTPTLNRARRDLLAAVGRGRVTTANGIIRRRRGELNLRCDVAVREFETAGWVVLGGDGCTYELTKAGQAVLGGDAQ